MSIFYVGMSSQVGKDIEIDAVTSRSYLRVRMRLHAGGALRRDLGCCSQTWTVVAKFTIIWLFKLLIIIWLIINYHLIDFLLQDILNQVEFQTVYSNCLTLKQPLFDNLLIQYDSILNKSFDSKKINFRAFHLCYLTIIWLWILSSILLIIRAINNNGPMVHYLIHYLIQIVKFQDILFQLFYFPPIIARFGSIILSIILSIIWSRQFYLTAIWQFYFDSYWIIYLSYNLTMRLVIWGNLTTWPGALGPASASPNEQVPDSSLAHEHCQLGPLHAHLHVCLCQLAYCSLGLKQPEIYIPVTCSQACNNRTSTVS